ncbi:hypothetical protein PVAP13_9NG413642 [Panicum virgatum]|uniref:Uncharacterized protein n=1 Tax=Panicum virgatum TaxID=38727 RepID=A0A8T0MVN9_PANVG|nr:hypothetical protein PVAP13_9NG413642 [Panicum virgatum]
MVSEGGSGSCAHIVQGCQQYGSRGVLSFPPPIDRKSFQVLLRSILRFQEDKKTEVLAPRLCTY